MRTPTGLQAAQADLKYIEATFGKKSVIANAFGVDRATVGRWSFKHNPEPENEVKIAALRLVLLKLLAFYAPTTAEKWLLGINAFLRDQRPIDFIKQGRIAEVMSAIEQEEAGGYA
jgi:uncharacterized protein (DUF2384 family)